MKIVLLLCTMLITAATALPQEKFQWPLKQLDTARDVPYLSKEEKDIILEMNKIRYNPAMYAKLHMKWMEVYYSDKMLKIPGKKNYRTHEGKDALLEAIRVLEKTEPAPILVPSRGMTRACELLVYDQSTTGRTGHRGSGNSTPSDRAERFGSFTGYYAENIHYGDPEPTFIVISLIIDDGVRSRGHRENILNPAFNYTGVAIGDHKTYGNMCVITYATEFNEK